MKAIDKENLKLAIKNFLFALAFIEVLMIVIISIMVMCDLVLTLIIAAFHIFPYHTVFAFIIFWLWLAFRLIHDEDN